MKNNHQRPFTPSPLNIIAIGAAPEAFHSLIECLNALPPADDNTLVLILHLAALDVHKMADLLNRTCDSPVSTTTENEPLHPGHAYLLPPDFTLEFRDDHLVSGPPPNDRTIGHPIDEFFQKIAHLNGPQSAAILLANSGNDGVKGLQAIQAAGGFGFLEDSPNDDATTTPPPLHSDHLLPLHEIAALLTPALFRSPPHTSAEPHTDTDPLDDSPSPRSQDADSSPDEPRRVLLVDQSKDINEMLSLLLLNDGHQTRQARHIDVALETAKDFKPHIAIIDIERPNRQGFTLANNLRDEFGFHIHLLAISNFRKTGDHLIEAGFDWHMNKPPHIDSLLAWIATRKI